MSKGIGVYKISLPSGSVYVGMTTRSFLERWKNHRKELLNGRHPCTGLLRAYRKYGIEALSFEVLEEVPVGTDDSVILKKEQEWWDRIKAQGVNIYNGRPSGTGSVQHTDETKARMVAASKKAWEKRKANGWQPKPKNKSQARSSNQTKNLKPRVRKPDKIEGTLVCPRCSVEFQPKRKSQSLCSRECARATNGVAGKKLFLTYDELYELYWAREMTCREIGEVYGVKQPTVEALMRRLAVPKRTLSEATRLSNKKKAKVDKNS